MLAVLSVVFAVVKVVGKVVAVLVLPRTRPVPDAMVNGAPLLPVIWLPPSLNVPALMASALLMVVAAPRVPVCPGMLIVSL